MEFRFSPRQLGLFGKRKKGKAGGGELYEPKNTVTKEEVERTENSRVSPYRRRAAAFDEPKRESFPRAAVPGPSAAAEAEARAALGGAKRAAKAPASYLYEGNGHPGGAELEFSNQSEAEGGLGTDANGNIIFEEDVVSFLKTELDRRRRERLPLELQWQLNGNFYDGNQYCDINVEAREVLPCGCRAAEGASREVFNRIAPLIETRIANLKKINYAMEVLPATNEADDCQKAKISTEVLRRIQAVSGFNSKKDTLILWNELCGSCFWLSWWDPSKGEESVRLVDELGGGASRERALFEGDVDYGLLTPYEVYPESIFKQTVADQGSIIIEQVKTVEEIENLYGVRVDGAEIDAFTLTPAPSGSPGSEATVISMGKAKMRGCQRVLTYFERRTRAFPRGRMAVLVGDSALVYYGPLPYDDIPIVRTVCKERAGQFFGKSVIEELIPLQRAYNTACNDIADYLKASKSFQYLVYQGQVDMDEFERQAGDPSAILTYKGDPGLPPVRQSAVAFSGDVFSQKKDLEGQMEYVAAVSQLMVYGQTPTGVTSGTAIESLRDIDNTRLALTGDYIRESVRGLARLWLGMYKKFARTYRIVRCAGANNLGAVLVWCGEDVTDYDVEFSTQNELMTSESSQWQRVLQLLQSGIADGRLMEDAAERARDFISSGGFNEGRTLGELQKQAAERENTLLRRGALPSVNDYDDHLIHAREHLRFILMAEFEALRQDKPALAEALVGHWQEHASKAQG